MIQIGLRIVRKAIVTGGRTVRTERIFGGLPAWEQIPDVGLYMDQVLTVMERTFDGVLPHGEITRSMVNNYVKAGLLPRPSKKKYDRDHLAMLIMIVIFKQALSMERIARLLALVCGSGAQAGYTRFIGEAAAMEESIRRGQIELASVGEEPGGQALRVSVSAAVCTILAGRLIDAQAGGGK